MSNKKIQIAISFFLLLLCSLPLIAANNTISGFRVWDSPEGSRLIIDLASKPKFEVFRLDNPERIVIDIQQTRLKGKVPRVKRNHSLLKKVRSAPRKNRSRRIVLDTKGKINYRSYELLPNREYGHRLVIELNSTEPVVAIAPPAPKPNKALRDIIIAIDAGHGGEDPGASGRNGTREKHVVLHIAKKLKKVIDEQNGFRAVLVRKGDYYLSLRKRMEIARENSADMFISVHADAYKNPRVKGSSVFVLSERGASDEAAKWIADQENSADLVGGVSLDDKDKTLAMVLLDLSQTATTDASVRVADNVLSEIGKIGPVHNDTVQHARFVVLKSPDIPSLLVETAFISNPREERRLNDQRYQLKLANAMLRGVKRYFKKNPPPNTLLAQAENTQTLLVEQGDTLSQIARSLKVSIATLKSYNQMQSENIRAGQVLNIPF
ncbi:MAG: N-acetylmuramoyl-L-alanine amidase [Gammaproteobacteria bacterium]|nr:N-acetylmuramoyl-L-alanine amidase [Gammaproteobacteria bacterium]